MFLLHASYLGLLVAHCPYCVALAPFCSM